MQIGDENVHRVRAVMDEIFGDENFCSLITFQTTTGQISTLLPSTSDHVVWYAKDRTKTKYRTLFSLKDREALSQNDWIEYASSEIAKFNPAKSNLLSADQDYRVFRSDNLTSSGVSPNTTVDYPYQGRTFHPGANHWKTIPLGLNVLGKAGRLVIAGKTLCYKRYQDDFGVSPISEVWQDTRLSTFSAEKIYVVQTNPKVIQRCLLMVTDPGDLVLDPTCGSGTTATVAEQWGRRWITIDTSRVALALARARIMGARFPFYLLADSREGQIKEAEVTRTAPSSQLVQGNIRHGFVYERVPHVTLKSIANNAEIDVIWDKWRAKLGPLREALNSVLGRVGKAQRAHADNSENGGQMRPAHPTKLVIHPLTKSYGRWSLTSMYESGPSTKR